MNLKILKEKRQDCKNKLDAILAKATKENRSLLAEERTQFDELESEYQTLEDDIKRLERSEQRSAAAAAAMGNVGGGTSDNTPEKKVADRYSLLRAIQLKIDGKPLDGLEREMHEEAVKEARASSLSITGIGVPSMIKNAEKRAMSVGTNTAGGHTVQTDVEQMIPNLEPRMRVEALGATILSGLQGNVSIPRNNGRGAAAWEGEVDTTAETTATLDNITMTPNRLAAFTTFSKQLLYQSNISVENFVRMDLNRATRLAVDAAAINGSGASNQPTGILNTAGINTVAMGTNGGVLTFAALIDMETQVAVDDADVDNMNYLLTPGLRGFLKSLKKDAGSGEFVWNQNMINGYNAVTSTQVPSTLDKGTSTGVCHAVIFGDWSQLIIGQWGPMDLTVDPYTLAGNGQVKLVVNSYWDVAARWAQAFSVIKDATLS